MCWYINIKILIKDEYFKENKYFNQELLLENIDYNITTKNLFLIISKKIDIKIEDIYLISNYRSLVVWF